MQKILIICPFLPYPLISGGGQAVFSAIDVLRFDYEIYFIYNSDITDKESVNILSTLWPEVKLLEYKRKKFNNKYEFWVKFYGRLSQLLFPQKLVLSLNNRPYSDIYYYSDVYLDYINNVIMENQIDIVQVEFVSDISLICALPKFVKTVFVHHEIRFVRNELEMREHNMTSLYYKYKYNILKKEELVFLSLYDAIITLSPADTEKLKSEGLTNVFSSFAQVKKDNNNLFYKDFQNYLTFLGPECHPPNKIGLEWFLSNCWAKILRADNKLKLKIIGEWTPSTQKTWCSQYDNIEFFGFVNNLYDVLAGSIMIVPITIGSGIRMKILEAVNWEIPFITTEIGVEGLPFLDKEDCFIGNGVEEFTMKIIQLKNDLELQKIFIKSAKDKIKSLFSSDKLKKSRTVVYEYIMQTE